MMGRLDTAVRLRRGVQGERHLLSGELVVAICIDKRKSCVELVQADLPRQRGGRRLGLAEHKS